MDRLTEQNPTWLDDEFWTAAREPDDELVTEVYLKLREYENTGLTPAEVMDLAQAKADGRLVVLLCKVGDTVFSLWSRVDGKRQYVRSATVTVSNFNYYLNRIKEGRSFVTRDEAQAALDRMEGQE